MTWVNPRSQDWWQLIQTSWTDRDWLKNFRMRRDTFRTLCNILEPYLSRQHTRYRRPHSVEIRVAICLWRLATNLEYRSISHLFGVGTSTCCVITQEVITAINTALKTLYLKKPSAADFRKIVQGFQDKWRFPQVVGAIDGTHVPIKAPTDTLADYFNRKGQYSIILQAVVDHKMRIWTETIEGVNVPLMILGDAAYPILPWLMKPFQESRAMTADQSNFNYRLSQARMTVERAFGRLKGRWRCLLKQNESHISLISQITLACCILHNFCEVHHEEYMEGEEHEDQDDEACEEDGVHPAQPGEPRAHDIRNALTIYFSRL